MADAVAPPDGFVLDTPDDSAPSPLHAGAVNSIRDPVALSLAVEAASKAGLPPEAFPAWVSSVHNESGWNLDETDGDAGEIGPGQVKPETGADMGFSEHDLRNPRQNLIASATYFGKQWRAGDGDPAVAMTGYNAGNTRAPIGSYALQGMRRLAGWASAADPAPRAALVNPAAPATLPPGFVLDAAPSPPGFVPDKPAAMAAPAAPAQPAASGPTPIAPPAGTLTSGGDPTLLAPDQVAPSQPQAFATPDGQTPGMTIRPFGQGEAAFVPRQSQLGADVNALVQGAAGGTAQAVRGVGEIPGATLLAGATNAAAQARAQLGVMDRIDAGTPVPATEDPLGYQDMSPAQRQQARAQYEQAIATMPAPADTALGRAGSAIMAGAGAVAAPLNRLAASAPVAQANEGFGTNLARGVGSALPAIFAGMTPGGMAAVAAVIGSQSYDSTYQEALGKGADPATAAQAAMVNGAAQAGIMSVPLSGAIMRVTDPALREGLLKTAINYSTHGIGMETAAEAGRFVDNYVARATYDPDRNPLDGVGANVAENVALGLLVPALHGAPRVASALGERSVAATPELQNAVRGIQTGVARVQVGDQVRDAVADAGSPPQEAPAPAPADAASPPVPDVPTPDKPPAQAAPVANVQPQDAVSAPSADVVDPITEAPPPPTPTETAPADEPEDVTSSSGIAPDLGGTGTEPPIPPESPLPAKIAALESSLASLRSNALAPEGQLAAQYGGAGAAARALNGMRQAWTRQQGRAEIGAYLARTGADAPFRPADTYSADDARQAFRAEPGMPADLASVITKLGGVRPDTAGADDLRSMDLHRRIGFFNGKSRFSVEQMADHLRDLGYLGDETWSPEGGPDTSSSLDVMMQALDHEKSGALRWSNRFNDAANENAYAIRAYNDAATQVADRLGMSNAAARQLTRGQVSDAMANLGGEFSLRSSETRTRLRAAEPDWSRIPPAARDARTELAGVMQTFMRFAGLPESTGLRLMDRIVADAQGNGANGRWDSAGNTLEFALDTDWQAAPQKFVHEMMHGLLDKLPAHYQAAIGEDAMRWASKPFVDDAGYQRTETGEDYIRRVYQTAADARGGWNTEAGQRLMREEAVSHMAEATLRDMFVPKLKVAQAIGGAGQFLNGIGRFLRGKGYRTGDQLLRAILNGERATPGSREALADLQPRGMPAAPPSPSPQQPTPTSVESTPAPDARAATAPAAQSDIARRIAELGAPRDYFSRRDPLARTVEKDGQTVMPGAEASTRQAIDKREQERLRGTKPQKDMTAFPLFDPDARKQRSLFSLRDMGGRKYVVDAAGSPDLGELAKDAADMIGREAGPIRLDSRALAHIAEQHGAQIRRLGYDSIGQFVAGVAAGYTKIYGGQHGRIFLVKPGRPQEAAVVQLRRAADRPNEWAVATAGIYRDTYAPLRGKPLWEGAREPVPDQGRNPDPRLRRYGQSDPDLEPSDGSGNYSLRDRERVAGIEGFYSPVARATLDLKQARGTGEQFLAMLTKTPGVKPEEMKWLGLDTWLRGQETVTRDQVLDYLRANSLDVREAIKGGPPRTLEWKSNGRGGATAGAGRDFYRIEALPNGKFRLEAPGGSRELGDTLEAAQARGQRMFENGGGASEDQPQYARYQLPGGESYRELLITLPPRAGGDAPPIGPYQSNHWNEPNVLAHARFSERTDADGKRTLHLEEVQSDWHQEGREHGYQEGKAPPQPKQFVDWAVENGATRPDAEAMYRRMLQGAADPKTQDWRREWHESQARRYDWEAAPPAAPFRTSWPALVLKRMIRHAVDNGFDRLAWTPGDEQARRYSGVADEDGNAITTPAEGMRGFYDKMLPAEMNKLVGRYGARVAAGTIDAGDRQVPVHTVEITPAMRTSVIEDGMPLFSLRDKVTQQIAKADEARKDWDQVIRRAIVPITTGTSKAQAVAARFANAETDIAWRFGVLDKKLQRQFTHADRRLMWDAMDEQSLFEQELREQLAQVPKLWEADVESKVRDAFRGRGLDRLNAEQRDTVMQLDALARRTWERMKERGLVDPKSEGLPFYTPRFFVMVADGKAEKVRSALGQSVTAMDPLGLNLSASGPEMRIERITEASLRKMRQRYGGDLDIVRDIRTIGAMLSKEERAIAGVDLVRSIKAYGETLGLDLITHAPEAGEAASYKTIDHPAMTELQPQMVDKALDDGSIVRVPRRDTEGNTVMVRVPLKVHSDFEGPLRAVLRGPPNAIYRAALRIKGMAVGAIMFSPLTHGMVIWSKALPELPGKVASFQVYFTGNRLQRDQAYMSDAIAHGLRPMGSTWHADITGIYDAPNVRPGHSLLAKALGSAGDLKDREFGDTLRRAVDTAGDFWHQKLLWDRVRDLQVGLYDGVRKEFLHKGATPDNASYMAAHVANRAAGVLPREALSNGANIMANIGLFSRSYTLGNLGMVKDMLNGMPSYVRAQIEQNLGAEAAGFAKSRLRRKAMAAFAVDLALSYAGTSVLQDGINMVTGQQDLGDVAQGYLRRLQNELQRVSHSPLELLNPFGVVQSLSSAFDHEPGKQNRIALYRDADGTMNYVRNPLGKVGEDLQSWITAPLATLQAKQSTLLRPLVESVLNSGDFGKPIYDRNAEGVAGMIDAAGRVVWHVAKAQLPVDAVQGAAGAVAGGPHQLRDALKVGGPLAGLMFSHGYPGGPEVGIEAAELRRYQAARAEAIPVARTMLDRGNPDAARQALISAGLTEQDANRTMVGLQNPQRSQVRIGKQFQRVATPEAQQRLQGETPPPTPAQRGEAQAQQMIKAAGLGR